VHVVRAARQSSHHQQAKLELGRFVSTSRIVTGLKIGVKAFYVARLGIFGTVALVIFMRVR
jgi:hypothetical protein